MQNYVYRITGILYMCRESLEKDTKQPEERYELKEIIKIITDIDQQYKAKWKRRTNKLIQLVDNIPRDTDNCLHTTIKLDHDLKTAFGYQQLVTFGNEAILRALF